MFSPPRKLFFTDYGTIAKVERCNMDGTNRTRIVEYKTEQPTAVTLDLVKKLVYWADAYLDFIEVVDYNGKNRHTIIQGNLVRCSRSWFLLRSSRQKYQHVLSLGVNPQLAGGYLVYAGPTLLNLQEV